MDVETWRHYFQVAKQYGINHYRFHSWCPPEACFEAADIEGIYLQPELPIWGNIDIDDTELCDYLLKEGRNLHRAYSNHASFVMFGLGNEMSGEEGLAMLIQTFKRRITVISILPVQIIIWALKESKRMKIISRLVVSGVKATSSSTRMPVPLFLCRRL